MMLYRKILIFTLACLLAGCSDSSPKPSTPLDTLKAYTLAIKKKDTTTMKLLLSEATIKMHDQAAKEQGVTLDDIVERETLFAPGQKTAEYRNEIIEGDRATIEMKNAYGVWDKVSFVKEPDGWKIDKQAFVDPILQQNEIDNQRLNEIINQGKQP